MFKIKALTLTAAVFALAANTLAFADTKAGAEWSYHGDLGPAHWGKLDKEYSVCATGKEQSPINITGPLLTDRNVLAVHYVPTAAQAAYDANTVLNVKGKKTIINLGHTLQINMPANNENEYITVNGNQYALVQFHFHTPSENLINNKQFPLEIHFVNQDNSGDLAVLGVMVMEGKYNEALQQLLQELPKDKQALSVANKLLVNVNALLPQARTYYSFMGSLTTPPCSEHVKWFVFSTPIEASKMQIDQLKTLLPENNARPVQKLNAREILQTISK